MPRRDREAPPKKGLIGRTFGAIKTAIKLILVILLCVFLYSIWRGFSSAREAAKDNPPPPLAAVVPASSPAVAIAPAPPGLDPPGVDEDGILELPGGTAVWLATTDADWDDMIDAENYDPPDGKGRGGPIGRMAKAGRARVYPNGTRVRVRRSSFLGRFVEVVDGEDAGRSGWIQVEFVRRPRPGDAALYPSAADRRMREAREADAARGQSNRDRASAEEAAAIAKADKVTAAEAARIKGRPDRAASLLAAGKNLERAGKSRLALDNYRKVRDEFSDTPAAAEAIERLKGLGER